MKSFLGFAFLCMALCTTAYGADGLKPETTNAANTIELTDAETAILNQVNAERASHGLHPLAIDPALLQRARAHAAWMATNNSMRHSPNSWENIAFGQGTPLGAMRTWMNSSGHRNNILARRAGAIGIGVYGTYYCQQFAPAAAPICKDGVCAVQQTVCGPNGCTTVGFGRPRVFGRVLGRLTGGGRRCCR